jgi:hypothetical protein
MGRVMPRDFVNAVGEYLDQAAPARKKEMTDANKARAEELVDADEDLAVDAAGTGVRLPLSSVQQVGCGRESALSSLNVCWDGEAPPSEERRRATRSVREPIGSSARTGV